jgi:pyruvate formate lyase activating enzyme
MNADAKLLEKYSVPGELYHRLDAGSVRCVACGHRCRIPEGRAGVCRVRFNRGGVLYVPSGYTAGARCDPIEKKPFFHVRPGSLAFSFGMLGCNYHCAFCQNWFSSQVLRDPESVPALKKTSADELIDTACAEDAAIVVSTYNEPLITAEWSAAVFRLAKSRGMTTAYVSNGSATPEALLYLRPWLDLYKVDLKSFDDRKYRRLGGRLEPVLDSIRRIHALGMWLEIVTLLVPGFNDSREEIEHLTGFLCAVSPDIPWHVTAFYGNYRMRDSEGTTPHSLLQAAEIGKRQGLRYVYAGNLPGNSGDWENTRCPNCGELLVERIGYRILRCSLDGEGACPRCKCAIPGRW